MKRSTRTAKRPETPAPATWQQLLTDAVHTPGTISAAFTAFPNYSISNQLLAMWQFHMHKRPIEPIATYKRWSAMGRQVRTGEHALITLCAPRTFMRKDKEDPDKKTAGVYFTYGKWWFAMGQTDGPDVTFPAMPEWDPERAITALGLQRVPFELLDGNTLGYSIKDRVAVSPLADDAAGTLVHELAHGLLHQKDSEESFLDGPDLPRNLREVEAEGVALILSEVLDLGHQSDHRGYLQHYLRTDHIPEENARRIMGCANSILSAGREIREDSKMEEVLETETAAA